MPCTLLHCYAITDHPETNVHPNPPASQPVDSKTIHEPDPSAETAANKRRALLAPAADLLKEAKMGGEELIQIARDL